MFALILPHRIFSSIISSHLTGGTFLPVLESPLPAAPKHSQAITDLTLSLHPHPVLLLAISSWSFSVSAAVVFRFLLQRYQSTHGQQGEVLWRQVWGSSLGPCRCCGWLAAARVWASQPEEGFPSQSALCPLTVSTLQTHLLPGDKQKLMRAVLRSSELQPSFSLWKSLPSAYNQMDFNVLTHPF